MKTWANKRRYVYRNGKVVVPGGELVPVDSYDGDERYEGEPWMLRCNMAYDSWLIYPDLFNRDIDAMIRPARRADCTDEHVQHCHDQARRARAARKMKEKEAPAWADFDESEEEED